MCDGAAILPRRMSCAICFANSFAVSFAQIPTCTWPGIHARYTKTFMSNNSSCNDSNFFNHSGFLQYSLPYVAKFTACKQSHKTKRRSGELLFVWDLQYCIAVCNPRTMMAWRLSTWPNCAGPFLTYRGAVISDLLHLVCWTTQLNSTQPEITDAGVWHLYVRIIINKTIL